MSWVNYTDEQRKASSDLNEANDCTVYAWSNVFDASYENSHFWLRKHAQRPNRKGLIPDKIKAAFAACRKAKTKVGPYTRKNRITVSAFLKEHPVGRYYVWNVNHAFVVKDGVVYDWQLGPRRQITGAVRVYLEGEI